jgi:precorrin-6x reductase
MTVHFIGAGPGAPDLLTLRGRDLIAASPVCLYAAALGRELTLPHVAQTVILTRTSTNSTAMPLGEDLATLGRSQATLALHLSLGNLAQIVAELTPLYGAACPIAVVYRASWPDPPLRVLILGGTREAYELAFVLAAGGAPYEPITSLAGRTAEPRIPAGALRSGGFGGVAGIAAYLVSERIDAVVDATHPFAARISANAVAACRQTQVPLVTFARPVWTPGADDRWERVADVSSAATLAYSRGLRLFLTIGRRELEPFATGSSARSTRPSWVSRATTRSCSAVVPSPLRTSSRSCARTGSTSWSPEKAVAENLRAKSWPHAR